MTRFRVAAVAAAAAFTAVLTTAGWAAASAALPGIHGTGTVPASRRSETYSWTTYDNPFGFKVKWTANSGHYYIRAHIKCTYPGVADTTVNGGWVTSVGVYSGAVCPSPYVLHIGDVQWKKTSSGTITTVQVYP